MQVDARRRWEFFLQCLFNPFHATSLFLYALKISENLSFYDVFKGLWIEISGMRWANAKDGFVGPPASAGRVL